MSSTTPNRSTWFSSRKPELAAEDTSSSIYKSLRSCVPDLNFGNAAIPQLAAVFAMGSLTTVSVVALCTRYFKRIPTSDWVRGTFGRPYDV